MGARGVAKLGRFAVTRPRVTLGVWALVTVLLAIEGLSFSQRIAPSSVDVPGTASDAAQSAAARYFGIEASVPILLEGPAAQVDRQGRALALRLRADRAYRVLSPWDQGRVIPEMRPRPGAALILVVARVKTTFAGATGKAVRRLADQVTRPPVHASVSGFSVVGADLKDKSLQATRDAERVAIPILLLVLLLVFRSPVAALIPVLFGVATVESGYGAVGLIATQHDISDAATALTSMMGLALGIDYSLLLVSRFREELRAGTEPQAAVRVAQASAGRTVLFAGVTLVVAMIVAIALSPGDFLLSAAVSVAVVAALSMAGALLAVPAMLSMVGAKVDAWRIGPVPRDGAGWARFARAVQRRPVRLGAAGLAPLLVLTVVALGLETGPPDVRGLPRNSRARSDAQRIAHVLGAGWTAPFEAFAINPGGPVTTPGRLKAMAAWQSRISRIPDVETVIGPGAIPSREPSLVDADREARRARRSLSKSRAGARTLSRGLGRARDGVGRLRGGLQQAAYAVSRIDDGAGQGHDGAARLAQALGEARAGADQLVGALGQAHRGSDLLAHGLQRAGSGSRILASGLRRATAGSGQLAGGLGQLASGLTSGRAPLAKLTAAARDANDQAVTLWRTLNTMTVGRADPRYRQALEAAGRIYGFTSGQDPRDGRQIDPAYRGLPDALAQADAQLGQAAAAAGRLHAGAQQLTHGLARLGQGQRRLASGLARLESGARRLAGGLGRLDRRSRQLPDGLSKLTAGADKLAGGLGRLQAGAGQVASGLGQGDGRVARLQHGLARAQTQTARAAQQSARQDQQLARVDDRSPRLLDSGYFVLAALDGSRRGARTQAGYAVNLDRGGQAARITIVPRSGANDPETTALRDRLQAQLPGLARASQGEAYLGGVAAQVVDYRRSLAARLPLLIAALSIVAFVLLVFVLRAIVLPLISVALNLLTVGAAFGLIALTFDGAHPPLGGPGYADLISLLSIFTIVFGLSLDYQVFILTRMREAWIERRDLEYAITLAIDRTGRVITGAAAIMGAVFVAFAFVDLTTVRQAGIGLAVAVLIDATLVRLVLLPAAMRLAGPATFWLPGWLDRRLPTLDLERPAANAG